MRSDGMTPFVGAIVAMTHDHVIGLNNDLPWHYADDLKHFKRITSGHTIIMGRKTWESIGRKPLPNRNNIVISRSPVTENITHYTNLEQAITDHRQRIVWIIGGGQIYAQALPFIDVLEITYVPDQINDDNAIRFPIFKPIDWRATLQDSETAPPLQFVRLERITA